MINFYLKKDIRRGTSLAVQWLRLQGAWVGSPVGGRGDTYKKENTYICTHTKKFRKNIYQNCNTDMLVRGMARFLIIFVIFPIKHFKMMDMYYFGNQEFSSS